MISIIILPPTAIVDTGNYSEGVKFQFLVIKANAKWLAFQKNFYLLGEAIVISEINTENSLKERKN